MSSPAGEATRAESAPLPALIVGAGPAGLATAACLKRRGVDALVLEAGPSLAESWRHHYERLHLHTAKGSRALPGMPFAKEVPRYPSRADVVAYLEPYAAHFGIAPRTGEAVRHMRAAGEEASSSRAPAPPTARAPSSSRRATTACRTRIACRTRNAFGGAMIHSRRLPQRRAFAGPARAGGRRRQHRRGDRARSRGRTARARPWRCARRSTSCRAIFSACPRS